MKNLKGLANLTSMVVQRETRQFLASQDEFTRQMILQMIADELESDVITISTTVLYDRLNRIIKNIGEPGICATRANFLIREDGIKALQSTVKNLGMPLTEEQLNRVVQGMVTISCARRGQIREGFKEIDKMYELTDEDISMLYMYCAGNLKQENSVEIVVENKIKKLIRDLKLVDLVVHEAFDKLKRSVNEYKPITNDRYDKREITLKNEIIIDWITTLRMQRSCSLENPNGEMSNTSGLIENPAAESVNRMPDATKSRLHAIQTTDQSKSKPASSTPITTQSTTQTSCGVGSGLLSGILGDDCITFGSTATVTTMSTTTATTSTTTTTTTQRINIPLFLDIIG